jgi:glycosyltransferase involved in cell wall biosynthesis
MGRILLVRSSAFRTSRVARTANALSEQGHEIHILSWNRGIDDERPPLQQQMEAKFRVDEVWVGEAPYGQGIWGVDKRLRYMWAVARRVRARDYDAVHAVDLDSALPVAMLRVMGLYEGSVVFDVADYIELYYTIPELLGQLIGKLSDWVLAQSDLIVLPDENRQDRVPSSLHSKIITVTNAPDFDERLLQELRETSPRSEALDVFYYGSLADDRGVHLLLSAAEQLPNVNVCFAGWGKNEDAVQQAAQNCENVEFFGMLSQEEVLRRAAAMGVIAMIYDPSYGVNQMASPNKLFEAMAIGRPVLVARGTSIDEFVERDDFGWAVNYDLDDLVRCLRSIDRESAREKAGRARELYERYKWPKSARRLQKAYRRLVGDGGAVSQAGRSRPER